MYFNKGYVVSFFLVLIWLCRPISQHCGSTHFLQDPSFESCHSGTYGSLLEEERLFNRTRSPSAALSPPQVGSSFMASNSEFLQNDKVTASIWCPWQWPMWLIPLCSDTFINQSEDIWPNESLHPIWLLWAPFPIVFDTPSPRFEPASLAQACRRWQSHWMSFNIIIFPVLRLVQCCKCATEGRKDLVSTSPW